MIIPKFQVFNQSRAYEKQHAKVNHVAHQWNLRISRALKRLGYEIWPTLFWLGVIPIPQFRLRHESQSFSWIWWIEHDIPPYDRYRCAAYRVELSLDEKGFPVLCIKSGVLDRILAGSDLAVFEKTLALASQEPPLIIHRNFGRVND